MSERKPGLNIDGEQREITPDNVVLSFFRNRPDMDYLEYNHDPEAELAEHTFIFNHRELLIWMGSACIFEGDDRILHLSNRENGSFKERYGWNPPYTVADNPNEEEQELFVYYETKQLDDTKQLEGFIKDE